MFTRLRTLKSTHFVQTRRRPLPASDRLLPPEHISSQSIRPHVLLSGEGIPLIEVTLPNNRTDGKVAKALLKKFVRVYGQKKGRIFLGDAGYDDRELYNFIVDKLKAEPTPPTTG